MVAARPSVTNAIASNTGTQRPLKCCCASCAPISRKIRELATNATYSQNGPKACRPAAEIEPDERKLPTTRPAVKAASTPEQRKCSATKKEPYAASVVKVISTR